MVEATNFGICCTISPKRLGLLDDSENEANPDNGLSLLIDSQSYDYGYSPHHSEGFKFSASSDKTFNQINEDVSFLAPSELYKCIFSVFFFLFFLYILHFVSIL